jgi:hypothetical protein
MRSLVEQIGMGAAANKDNRLNLRRRLDAVRESDGS